MHSSLVDTLLAACPSKTRREVRNWAEPGPRGCCVTLSNKSAFAPQACLLTSSARGVCAAVILHPRGQFLFLPSDLTELLL